MPPAHCEIAIVGGGPAGALAALTLARLGRDVILCEAESFPRDHVGICLNIGAAKILRELGLGAILRNPAHRESRILDRAWEGEALERVPRQDLICNRGVLDLELLRAAAGAGVRVFQPCKVFATTQSAAGWQLAASAPSGVKEITSRFLIEASGRRSASRRRRLAPPAVALSSRWHGEIEAVRLVASRGSWTWAAPTAAGDTAAVTVLAATDERLAKQGLAGIHRRLLREAGFAAPAAGPDAVTAIDVTPFDAFHADAHRLRIGEAALGLDPLSSSGLSAAMQSALAGAVAVHTLLDPGGDHCAAVEFVRASHARKRDRHLVQTVRAYASVVPRFPDTFWQERSGFGDDETQEPVADRLPLPATQALLRRSRATRTIVTPCATLDRIERVAAVLAGEHDDPVAFVEGVLVAPLIDGIRTPTSAAGLVAQWTSSIGTKAALQILGWAWQNRVLVECEA